MTGIQTRETSPNPNNRVQTSFKQNAWSEPDICNLRCVDIETKVAYKRVISGRCAKPGPDPAPGFFVRWGW
jgi:hypothetical protein